MDRVAAVSPVQELGTVPRRFNSGSGPARSERVALAPPDQVRNDERVVVCAPPRAFSSEGAADVQVREEAPDDAPDENH